MHWLNRTQTAQNHVPEVPLTSAYSIYVTTSVIGNNFIATNSTLLQQWVEAEYIRHTRIYILDF